jgi:hypothetical protein
MSSRIYTELTIKGTPKQLFKMLKAIQEFEETSNEKYLANHDCGYIENAQVVFDSELYHLHDLSDEDLEEFLQKTKQVPLDISGPFGKYSNLAEVNLFNIIAEAAPQATMTGASYDDTDFIDAVLRAEQHDGKLHLENYQCTVEDVYLDYMKAITDKLSYNSFRKDFQLEKRDFSFRDYQDFIDAFIGSGQFPDLMPYEEFLDECPGCQISEQEFDSIIENIKDLDLPNLDVFKEKNKKNYTAHFCYDPFTKEYIPLT